MSRIHAIGIIVACGTVILSGGVLAQTSGYGSDSGPGWWQGWGMGWMMHPPGRGRYMMIDANDDGVISAEEAASAADEVFTAMDVDDDGSLTKEEYMAVRMGPQRGFNPDRQAAMQKRKEARFSEMDADSDGNLSKAEFLDAAQAHHAGADSDGDGNVTPWEHRRQNWN
jgi:Ca2+-binding EF-hand superfamily protein